MLHHHYVFVEPINAAVDEWDQNQISSPLQSFAAIKKSLELFLCRSNNIAKFNLNYFVAKLSKLLSFRSNSYSRIHDSS